MYIYRVCLLSFLLFLLGCDFSGSTSTAKVSQSQTECKNNKPCHFENQVKVWLSEETLSPETPLSIYAQLPTDLKITRAKLEGVTMYMGYIPVQFTEQGNIWLADTMVGICSEQNMVWKLVLTTVDLTTSANQTVEYYFNVTY
ncbi:hypothetical protein R0K04_06610 [Pseudoalteromonas sp. SIMBA_153]